MTTKTCRICKTEKPLDEFSKRPNRPSYRNECNPCRYAARKAKLNADPDKLQRHKEKIREWRETHPNEVKTLNREWQEANKDHVRAYRVEYVEKNREAINKRQNEYIKRRRRECPWFRAASNLRRRVLLVLQFNSKSKRFFELLGCDLPAFRSHIENLWKTDMTWDNYGDLWHIDHITPCRAFDLTNPEEQAKCFHFSNLQPLYKAENLSKLDRLPDGSFARSRQFIR